ncbi:hypothetical protein [Paraglaciecola aestuariivivens]
MKYSQEHGDYVFARSQQAILFSGRGPWNNETLQNGSRIVGGLIRELNLDQAWGGLSCLYGESLMPPSTYDIFVKQNIIRKSKGMKRLAVVIQDSDIANTIQNQLTKAYLSVGIEFAFLDSIEQAMDWLVERDIQLDKQEVLTFFNKHKFKREFDD